jgi:hypothetical protein
MIEKDVRQSPAVPGFFFFPACCPAANRARQLFSFPGVLYLVQFCRT